MKKILLITIPFIIFFLIGCFSIDKLFKEKELINKNKALFYQNQSEGLLSELQKAHNEKINLHIQIIELKKQIINIQEEHIQISFRYMSVIDAMEKELKRCDQLCLKTVKNNYANQE